ncbi:putative inactive methyltransferase [Panicum miliaceum]|uniref:Inactive methyltransferase n=1 Tax=Panicum miliaceum TaxID=4540 RepID=A0A3L6Q3N5_PANMI|nr:putative inactive methyltransferase [Panicum miliaceum]
MAMFAVDEDTFSSCGPVVANRHRSRQPMGECRPAYDYFGKNFALWMLHMQSDEECFRILMNCHRALPDNGKVIVIQSILPETLDWTPASRDSFAMDIIILVMFKGRKEMTEQECAKLARDAGFAGFKSTYIFCNIYALEFTK